MSDGLDEADARIVAALQADGRAELLDIAAETGLPGTTVRDRLAALEDRGVVRGHTVRVDYDRAGYACPVVIRLRVADDAVPTVTERLRDCPRIHSVYELTGPWNLFAVGRFRSREEFDTYCSRLVTDAAVEAVDVDVVAETVKEGEPVAPRVPVTPRE
ncbi:Lrp/AsnC family transcriptional regulator [Natronomonas sp. EA1]|uniref:Lrp/AsnC family transcriptional regulator n=1 Tax=Natronomonas sp. EA1 TaxID=3421655 RepID=UPI003EB9DA3F